VGQLFNLAQEFSDIKSKVTWVPASRERRLGRSLRPEVVAGPLSAMRGARFLEFLHLSPPFEGEL